MKKKIVVLSGAGISAESGLATFRDAGGLWEGHKIEDVATPEAWKRNPELVLAFYNQRRKAALAAMPNEGHLVLVNLEKDFEVRIITQNVDDLHERAGSTSVMHLHGELFLSRSTVDEKLIYPIKGWELTLGQKCEKGSQLRPHIVWFGEMVPMISKAVSEIQTADMVIVVGTSLQVYPAAGLLDYIHQGTPIFLVNPDLGQKVGHSNVIYVKERASVGLPMVVDQLMKK